MSQPHHQQLPPPLPPRRSPAPATYLNQTQSEPLPPPLPRRPVPDSRPEQVASSPILESTQHHAPPPLPARPSTANLSPTSLDDPPSQSSPCLTDTSRSAGLPGYLDKSPHGQKPIDSPSNDVVLPRSETAPKRQYCHPTVSSEAGDDTATAGNDSLTQNIEEMLQDLSISAQTREMNSRVGAPDGRTDAGKRQPADGLKASNSLLSEADQICSPRNCSSQQDGLPLEPKKPVTGVTSCLNTPVTFPSTWHHHPDAPDFVICSRCYDEHLRGTTIEGDFQGGHMNDGRSRICRFGIPRITECLLKESHATKSTRSLVEFMKRRATIVACKGIDGAKGTEGIKWFVPKNGECAGLVICEACFEDHIVPRSLASHFEPAQHAHQPNDVWACDFAVSYVETQYKKRSEANDWPGFVQEASARIRIPACPKTKRVERGSRTWFCPVERPEVLICPACFCDYVLDTGEERKWCDSSTKTNFSYANEVTCALGHLSLNVVMRFAYDKKDFMPFWEALEMVLREPACVSEGGAEGEGGPRWFTLSSKPPEFAICGACHDTMIKSMGITDLFMPREPDTSSTSSASEVSRMSSLGCALNPSFPRFSFYLTHLLQAYYTHDASSLASFALEYASLPLCRRSKDLKNGIWYGWPECTICPSCHHDVVRGTFLADRMTYAKPVRIESSTMCEMYSPRMRSLYAEACAAASSDTDAEAVELRVFSDRRRLVYTQTVMVIEQILVQERIALGRQQMLNSQSLFYTSLGYSVVNTIGPNSYSYGSPGVGYGFENQYLYDGAKYGKQARDIGASIGSGANLVRVEELERQWRAVE